MRIACGSFMLKKLEGINLNRIDVLDVGVWYDYGSFRICPIELYHDVPNFGYRIFFPDYKILHATDTAHMEGISAKGYDLYALEFNHDAEEILERI